MLVRIRNKQFAAGSTVQYEQYASTWTDAEKTHFSTLSSTRSTTQKKNTTNNNLASSCRGCGILYKDTHTIMFSSPPCATTVPAATQSRVVELERRAVRRHKARATTTDRRAGWASERAKERARPPASRAHATGGGGGGLERQYLWLVCGCIHRIHAQARVARGASNGSMRRNHAAIRRGPDGMQQPIPLPLPIPLPTFIPG